MKWLILFASLTVSSFTADLDECYLNNQAGWGGDIQNGRFKIASKDKTECYKACRRLAECTAFLMRKTDGQCWLKKEGHKDPRATNNYVFGKMECFNEKIAADPKDASSGDLVTYKFTYQTNNQHDHDGGSWDGYWFTVIGTEGETAEHDCAGNKTKGVMDSCTFEDRAVIGDVTGLRIHNGYDNTWKFNKIAGSVNGVGLPTFYGYESVEDFKSVTIKFSADPESCYQQNIDMSGGDLGSLVPEPKTNSECYKACKRYAACIAFTMTKWGRCYLKGDKRKDPSKNNNAVSGRMECFKEKLAAAASKDVTSGDLVTYKFTYQTNNQHDHDGGSWDGYWFTVIGTEGETSEHDCAGNKTKGVTDSCTFEDRAVIGDVTGLRIHNGFDNTWKFNKIAGSVNGVDLPTFYGYKSVPDFKSVTIKFSADPESCYIDKTDVRGGDLVSYVISKKDKAECYKACSRHPKCTAFTMETRGGRCYLKDDRRQDPSTHNTAVSGLMVCFREKSPAEPESEYVNVARMENVTVAQSGHRHGANGERAVDGNWNTIWNLAGCSYSWFHQLNYWQITLRESYNIDHVIIYGSSDMEDGVLNGARLIIGGQLCQKISGMEENPTEGHKFDCNGDDSKRKGKVVRIENWYKKLVICEIEINVRKDELEEVAPTLSAAESLGQEIEEFYNVAWRKSASQSSVRHGGSAEKAVDGWTIQTWSGSDGSCTHTQHQGSDVWRVDLGRVYQIDHIRVWGLDNHMSAYMAGTLLWVDSNLCGRMKDKKKEGPEHVKCDSPQLMAGRHITIAAGSTFLAICEVQVMVKKTDINKVPTTMTWPGEKAGDFTNVALNHGAINEVSTAKQSSTLHNGVARRANDGNRDGHWSKNSVTHTDRSGAQYWQVDLGRVYKIHHITLYGRTDCCSERIEGARVVVGKSQQVATDIKKPAKPADPIKIDLSEGDEAVYGRRVTVELVNQVLSLAEVEVWVSNEDVFGEEKPTTVPTLENVAIRRPTKQSSTHDGQGPARAVDNFPSKLRPDHGSCSHTRNEPINFWEVDLEKEYHIDHIKVLGRNDNDGAAKRINGATLVVDGRTVGGFVYHDQNKEFVFPLNGLKGRLVRIVRTNEYLTLCEVQVIVNHEYEPDESAVEPVEKEQPNLASSAKVSSSTVMYGATAGLATDGNVESNFFRGSCFLAGPTQNDNWVKLDLPKQTKVGSVAVYPRLDYFAHEVIDGAMVRAGDHTCGSISYESGKLFYQVDCGGTTASQITISKPGWLSLCEVVAHAS